VAKDGPVAPKIEPTFMLASLLMSPERTGVSSSDLAKGRTRARDLFDRGVRDLESARTELARRANQPSSTSIPVRQLGEEVSLHVEIARLWTEDPSTSSLITVSVEKAGRALQTALQIARAAQATNDNSYARLLNNVGALLHGEGQYEDAQRSYEEAMGIASALDPDVGESLQVTILYNLGRASEDSGDLAAAADLYAKLIGRHPEYVDGMMISYRCIQRLMVFMQPKSDRRTFSLPRTESVRRTSSSSR
jgi:RNA polymerase-associated protein CTR9